MSQFEEVVEELRVIYACQNCGNIQQYAFVTKHDETITRQEELESVLESLPCRFCRFEKLKFREKRLVIRRRGKD